MLTGFIRKNNRNPVQGSILPSRTGNTLSEIILDVDQDSR